MHSNRKGKEREKERGKERSRIMLVERELDRIGRVSRSVVKKNT